MKSLIIIGLQVGIIYGLGLLNPVFGIIAFLVVAQFVSFQSFVGSFAEDDILNTPPIIRELHRGEISIFKVIILWQLISIAMNDGKGLSRIILHYLGANQFTSLALFTVLIDDFAEFPVIAVYCVIFFIVYWVATNLLVAFTSAISANNG